MNGLNPFASLAIAVTLASGTPARADLSISKDATHNVSCSGGVCTPTAKNAVLNVGDLTNMLLAHDLTVQTGSGDGTAASISIVDGFSWADNNRLTLSAKKSITVKAAVTVAGDGADHQLQSGKRRWRPAVRWQGQDRFLEPEKQPEDQRQCLHTVRGCPDAYQRHQE